MLTCSTVWTSTIKCSGTDFISYTFNLLYFFVLSDYIKLSVKKAKTTLLYIELLINKILNPIKGLNDDFQIGEEQMSNNFLICS